MTIDSLLRLLADGEFHSGEDLGRELKVSRAAVWKQLQKLQEHGLAVEKVRGKGYRLPGGIDLLSVADIESRLTAAAARKLTTLDVRQIVDSTNTLALQYAAAEGKSGYVCAAEQQTAGRGRRGRTWVSPYGANLCFSLLWQFEGGAAALEGLSLAVGVAVGRCLLRHQLPVQLKWPNDILCRQRKLAGILLEMQGDAAGTCQVVIGIGLNIALSPGAAADIDQPWTDLATEMPQLPSRSHLLADLLNELVLVLDGFTKRGFAAYRDEWLRLDAYCDREVAVHLGESVILGTAAGVDASGALLVDTARGRQVFNGGEISLRGQP